MDQAQNVQVGMRKQTSFKADLADRIASCEDDVEQAKLQHNMGVLCSDMGENVEAEQWLTSALEAREKLLGLDHPDTLDSMHELGVLCQQLGNFRHSEELLSMCFELRKRSSGEKSRETLESERSLGVLYSDKGDFEKSKMHLKQCVMEQQESLGVDDMDTICSMLNLADVYNHERKYSQAEIVYEKCLEKQEKLLGPRHFQTSRTRIMLGTTMYLHKQFDDSHRVLCEQSLDMCLNNEENEPEEMTQTRRVNNYWAARAKREQEGRATLQVSREAEKAQAPKKSWIKKVSKKFMDAITL